MAFIEFTTCDDQTTVSAAVWQVYRGPAPGVVEAIYAATPGLAALGPRLPVGTRLLIPSPATPEAPADRPQIRLW